MSIFATLVQVLAQVAVAVAVAVGLAVAVAVAVAGTQNRMLLPTSGNTLLSTLPVDPSLGSEALARPDGRPASKRDSGRFVATDADDEMPARTT